MGEIAGALAAVLSSFVGGTAIGATRYLAAFADPLLVGTFRFGIGFLVLTPLALATGGIWPARRDLPAVVLLGLAFFALFPIVFNAALGYTTAARGSVALSTIPLQTMLLAALLGIEPLTARKSLGVALATLGVAIALVGGLEAMPAGAWRGDLLMLLAAFVMSATSIASRGLLKRSSPLTFTVIAMLAGTIALGLGGALRGSFAAVAGFETATWVAAVYLGVAGGALAFFLWSLALRYTTPTLAGISVTVNPISASLVGAVFLGEPLSWNLAAGLAAIVAGISLAVIPVGGLRLR